MDYKLYMILFSLLTLSTLSCGKEEVKPKPADVKVSLKTYVKDKEAVEGEIKYTTVVGHDYSLLTLTYYLSRISLVEDDGTVVELSKAHLFDLHKEDSKSFTATKIPAGQYKAMTFTFGFKKADNIVDFLPNTVANANMAWPEQLGPGAYHYMKFEGNYNLNNSGTIKSFKYHLGPSKGGDYSFDVNQPIDLKIDESAVDLSIIMDIDQWLNGTTDYDFEVWGPGIMGKPDAQALAQGNGVGVFSVFID